MKNTFYSTLYSLMEKGDVERRTIFSTGATALYQEGTLMAKSGDGDFENPDLVETIKAEPHLVIFGAGHVSKAIADFAHLLSMEVTVIDERAQMANKERFPYASEIIVEDYGAFLSSSRSFFRPYYIIVTHGHSHDRECLEWCLERPYAYLGMIGSKGKVAKTFAALEEKGVSPSLLSSVHAPIGLDIGAVTPEEIAVSILSEVIGVFRKTKYSVTISPEYLKEVEGKEGIGARIVEKRGSAPRAVGSEIFVERNGNTLGTVGGGKLEKETIGEALSMLEKGEENKLIDYNLSSEGDLGMICGGEVRMLFTRVRK